MLGIVKQVNPTVTVDVASQHTTLFFVEYDPGMVGGALEVGDVVEVENRGDEEHGDVWVVEDRVRYDLVPPPVEMWRERDEETELMMECQGVPF